MLTVVHSLYKSSIQLLYLLLPLQRPRRLPLKHEIKRNKCEHGVTPLADEVLAALEDPRWAHVVSAVVSGHQHEGGLHTTEEGTHFVVMESPMLAVPGEPGPYAVVEAHGEDGTGV